MSDILALKSVRSGPRLRIGFLRLTDSAPAIVAQEGSSTRSASTPSSAK